MCQPSLDRVQVLRRVNSIVGYWRRVLWRLYYRLAPMIDLVAHGIDEAQAADLRARLHAFAVEWDNPEMDGYSDYAAARSTLETR